MISFPPSFPQGPECIEDVGLNHWKPQHKVCLRKIKWMGITEVWGEIKARIYYPGFSFKIYSSEWSIIITWQGWYHCRADGYPKKMASLVKRNFPSSRVTTVSMICFRNTMFYWTLLDSQQFFIHLKRHISFKTQISLNSIKIVCVCVCMCVHWGGEYNVQQWTIESTVLYGIWIFFPLYLI